MKNMLLYRSIGKYSVTSNQSRDSPCGVLWVKSDSMSFESGSMSSSSSVISRRVRGDRGIVGSDMDAVDAFTKACILVSGAILSVSKVEQWMFTLVRIDK
jgi:hypothetical protein